MSETQVENTAASAPATMEASAATTKKNLGMRKNGNALSGHSRPSSLLTSWESRSSMAPRKKGLPSNEGPYIMGASGEETPRASRYEGEGEGDEGRKGS